MQDTISEKNRNIKSFGDRIRQNEDWTLKEIYIANFPAIEKYILANSGTRDDAKDIYQESFLAFWRNIQLGRFEAQHPNAISSYLMRIARNKWIDVLRKSKKMTVSAVENDYADDAGDNPLNPEEEEYLSLVKRHYKNLGEPCKELLYKFYFRKELLKQIAAYFSWTEATAKNNKYRCLQKLRNAVLNQP